jgi:hypothetical protein
LELPTSSSVNDTRSENDCRGITGSRESRGSCAQEHRNLL